ncbi:MAG TPA: hypothetical protein VK054_07195 [Beutenbergiaceae bacterium]|nr:hypothetical protein [Beutenbergiaceae bacterium]
MTSQDRGGAVVVVTLQMIYEKVLGVEATVQRIDSTLAEVVKDSEDHEQRIRTLEHNSGRLSGKLAGIAASVSLVGGGIVSLIISQLL